MKPLIDIHKSLGGWPVVVGDEWDESNWSWTKSVKDFRARGYSTDYILDFSVSTDLKNSMRRAIDVSYCDNFCISPSLIYCYFI